MPHLSKPFFADARLQSLRPALPLGVVATGALTLWIVPNDATAAAVGGVATSVSVVAAIVTLLLIKGWPSHFGLGGLSTLAGLAALVAGLALLWRSGLGEGLRGFVPWRGTAPVGGGAATVAAEPVVLPAGVERGALLDELRSHFDALQAAWDAGAEDAMRVLTTPEMLDELCTASSAGGGSSHRTEFLNVKLELLLFEERDSAQVVCVEYSGMVREWPSRDASPFREFWMLMRPEGATAGWRLVRHQALL